MPCSYPHLRPGMAWQLAFKPTSQRTSSYLCAKLLLLPRSSWGKQGHSSSHMPPFLQGSLLFIPCRALLSFALLALAFLVAFSPFLDVPSFGGFRLFSFCSLLPSPALNPPPSHPLSSSPHPSPFLLPPLPPLSPALLPPLLPFPSLLPFPLLPPLPLSFPPALAYAYLACPTLTCSSLLAPLLSSSLLLRLLPFFSFLLFLFLICSSFVLL